MSVWAFATASHPATFGKECHAPDGSGVALQYGRWSPVRSVTKASGPILTTTCHQLTIAGQRYALDGAPVALQAGQRLLRVCFPEPHNPVPTATGHAPPVRGQCDTTRCARVTLQVRGSNRVRRGCPRSPAPSATRRAG